jgi:chromosome segregation ATPase
LQIFPGSQIKELKSHLAKLDKDLHDELEKEAVLAKQLAEEKMKEAELEQNLANTKAELLKDEASLAEDKKVFASKDAEIKDLKKRLAAAEKKHVPCDDLIASLRKQIAALETTADYSTVTNIPRFLFAPHCMH